MTDPSPDYATGSMFGVDDVELAARTYWEASVAHASRKDPGSTLAMVDERTGAVSPAAWDQLNANTREMITAGIRTACVQLMDNLFMRGLIPATAERAYRLRHFIGGHRHIARMSVGRDNCHRMIKTDDKRAPFAMSICGNGAYLVALEAAAPVCVDPDAGPLEHVEAEGSA